MQKIKKFPPLVGNKYAVCNGISGLLDGFLVFAGGGGFIKPLANGGAKQLSNHLRLYTHTPQGWQLIHTNSVFVNYQPYGFANSVHFVFDSVLYCFGGYKMVANKIIPSYDLIKITLTSQLKFQYEVFENFLPFGGEIGGGFNPNTQSVLLTSHNEFVCFDIAWLLQQNQQSQIDWSNKHHTSAYNLNASLTLADQNEGFLLLGGYCPYNKEQFDSNRFYTSRILVYQNQQINLAQEELCNPQNITFLGASALVIKHDLVYIFGSVNAKIFTEAIHQCNTLANEELAAFKRDYFSYQPQAYAFNDQIYAFDLTTKTLNEVQQLPYGLAGNPNVVLYDNHLWLLAAELKPGVRLNEVWKIPL